jgi:RNase P subunit RPR2
LVYIIFGDRFSSVTPPAVIATRKQEERASANRYSSSHKEIATFISKHEIYLILVTTQAYCVKCKAKRDMKNEKQVTMKNGRQAVSGTCSVCGTKMFKIGGSSSAGSAVAKQRPKVKAASKKPAGKATKAKTNAKKSKTKSKK